MKQYFIYTIAVLLSVSSAADANTDHHSQLVKQSGIDTLKKDGIDPVCKMKVKAGNVRTHSHDKIVYGFCSDACKKIFIKQPERYLRK